MRITKRNDLTGNHTAGHSKLTTDEKKKTFIQIELNGKTKFKAKKE